MANKEVKKKTVKKNNNPLKKIKNKKSIPNKEISTKVVANDKLYLKNIIGCSDAKKFITRRLDTFYNNPTTIKNIEISMGIILFGYPGVGKTALTEACVNEYSKTTGKKFNIVLTNGEEFGSNQVNVATKLIEDEFEKYRNSKLDTILIIDECDLIFKSSASTTSVLYLEKTNTFKRMLNNRKMNNKLFIIGTTNRPHAIDKAFHRRLKFIHIELPNYDERILHLKKCFNELVKVDCEDLEILATNTNGYSGDTFNKLRTEIYYDLYIPNNEKMLNMNDVDTNFEVTEIFKLFKKKDSALKRSIDDFENKFGGQ